MKIRGDEMKIEVLYERANELLDEGMDILSRLLDRYRYDRHNTYGFEFDVRFLNYVDIPEWVVEELGDSLMDFINEYIRVNLEVFEEDIKKSFSWVKDIFLTGRSGGWLVVRPDVNILLYEAELSRRGSYLDFLMDDIRRGLISEEEAIERLTWLIDDIEDDVSFLRGLEKDLKEIERKVKEGLKIMEKELSSEEFWKSILGLAE